MAMAMVAHIFTLHSESTVFDAEQLGAPYSKSCQDFVESEHSPVDQMQLYFDLHFYF
jgi:hypothetical protein